MKVWVVIIDGYFEKRKGMRGFAKREDAVAEMKKLFEALDKHYWNYDVLVELEEVDNMLVIAVYEEQGEVRYEKAIMTELNVTETSNYVASENSCRK